MEWVMSNWSDVVTLALAVLGVASIVAKMTPTEADNKVVDMLYKLVNALGLTKK